MNIVLTREQVRSVDRLALEHYGMSGLVLMENAGRNAADIIECRYGNTGRALICCGVGNNGGDGCVIARHLANAGWALRVMIAGDPARMTPDTSANHTIIKAMNLPIEYTPDAQSQLRLTKTIERDELIVDALLGTGFSGKVRSPIAELIHALNQAPRLATVAIDIPSGLDCDTGTPANATIRADLTITFVAEKPGLAAARDYTGRVEVAGIGAPQQLITEIHSTNA